MLDRRTALKSAAAFGAIALASPALSASGKPVRAVATFSILGDMVSRIGGDHIALTTLVGPDGDTHVYQPTPADAGAVGEADVLFVNGLEFEGWLDRLIGAAEFDGMRVVATDGVDPIAFEEGEGHHHEGEEHVEHTDDDHADDHGDDHGEEHAEDDHHDHGEFDPHAWQSLGNVKIYARNIAAALTKADPGNAAAFESNRATYVAEIEALDAEIRAMLAALPEDRRTIVTSHDAFQYFGRDYGLTFLAPQGLSTESEASAKDVAGLIERIREDEISAVFVENITDRRLLEQIARETGAGIGGTLYPGALSGPDGPAATYLDMMRHNATTLAQALAA
ncbi:MAG: metal ABC transporter substrate-binding protein [Pseudomonadota bacterium]